MKTTLLPTVTILFSILACITVLNGCSKGDEQLDLTKTETLRLQVPPEVAGWMYRAEVAMNKGNYNMAFALMDSVEAVMPELADLYFMRGRLYTRINDLQLSQVAYHQVLELDPEYAGANFNMGLNAFRRGLLRQAVNYYKEEEAINKDPDSVLYLELGKTYAQLGEPDSARMSYEKGIEINPENPTIYMWMGQLMEEIGELDKALEYSHKGAMLKPGDPDYEYIIGALYFRNGNLDSALKYLEPAAEQMPYHQGVQYNLGQVLQRVGRADEAEFYLVRADSAQQMQQRVNEAVNGINSDPGNRDKWIELAIMLWQTGQRERAVESYMTAVNIDPTNFGLQSNLAMMLVESGRIDDGINRYETILRIRPDLTEVWINLGAAYANNGEPEKARLAWEKALENDPQNQRAKDNLMQL